MTSDGHTFVYISAVKVFIPIAYTANKQCVISIVYGYRLTVVNRTKKKQGV